MKSKVQSIKPTTASLRRLLMERGLTLDGLAKLSGLSTSSILCQMGTCSPRQRPAWKIEKAINAPVWTSPIRFSDLRRASDFIGTDFVLTGFHALRRAIVAKGVRHTRTLSNKDALLARVLAHLSELETQKSK